MMPKRKAEKTVTGKVKCNKRLKPVSWELNPKLESCLEEFRSCWDKNEALLYPTGEDSNIELLSEPFKLCIIKDFIQNGNSLLRDLKDELDDLQYKLQDNDMYHFYQTADIGRSTQPTIRELKDLLTTKLKNWIIKATGLPLNNKLSLTAARYEGHDHLLCHDDRVSNRKIAFILYMCKNWEAADGGSLDIFNTDENGDPLSVVRSIIPGNNILVFFEVTDKSFHQVAEVLNENKVRLTVGGWFHVNAPEIDRVILASPHLTLFPPQPSELLLKDWINMTYLDSSTHEQVNQTIEETSAVALVEFLLANKLTLIETALKSSELNWKVMGPANKRHYEVIDIERVPPAGESAILWQFVELMKSPQFFDYLYQLTELDIGSDKRRAVMPLAHVEVQRWNRGCYTLLHDVHNRACLKVILYLGHQCSDKECGGEIYFMAQDTGEELCNGDPFNNTLNIMYQDKSTVHFTRFINSNLSQPYYAIQATYFEREKR